MVRKFFEEVQSYGQNRAFWYLLVVLFLSIFIPVLYGMYGQLVLGEPWGNEPMPDNGLIALFFVIIFIYGVMAIALLSVKQEIYVDRNGIHYQNKSKKILWTTISKNDLASFEIRRKRRNIFEPGGVSYFKKHVGKSTSVFLSGAVHLELTLGNKHKVLIGTRRPEEFERAIRKMMETDTYHGG